MGGLTQALLALLQIVGICLCLAGLVAVACAVGWMVLRAADYWGQWMDEHPEREGKKRG